VLRDAVQRSDRIADPYTRVRLYWSLGRLAANDGRPHVSLGYFRRAVALLEATEDTLHLARAHLSCAWVLISSGSLSEASTHLQRAEELLGPHPEPVDVVMLRRNQAELARREGDADRAVARAREAIQLAGDAYPDERGSAWLVVAQARAMQGSVTDAERAYEEAAHLLDQGGTVRDRAECYRAWGRLLRNAGREAEALDVLERAADFAVDVRPQGLRVDH
jgi:tetratricopeptide (TPR) repeat protein